MNTDPSREEEDLDPLLPVRATELDSMHNSLRIRWIIYQGKFEKTLRKVYLQRIHHGVPIYKCPDGICKFCGSTEGVLVRHKGSLAWTCIGLSCMLVTFGKKRDLDFLRQGL